MRGPPVVYDNVFSPSASLYLHTAASIGSLGDEQHTVFDRSLPPRTVLETALNSVLQQLGDDAPHVEYWWRDTWELVDAHADVDEYGFEDYGKLRYPEHGHVLYLAVGPAVEGPTAVWEPVEGSTNSGADAFGALTIVPACEGRLLRFQGDCMHAVPRPADVWLQHRFDSADGTDVWRSSADLPVEDEAEARPPPAAHDLTRSVVLFNTWQDAPVEVDTAPATDPLEVVKEFAADFGGAAVDEKVAILSTPDALCQLVDQWRRTSPQLVAADSAADAAAAERTRLRVRLMGKTERHAHTEDSIELPAPAGLRDALVESSAVTSFSSSEREVAAPPEYTCR
jgi:hypothetical protein